VTLVYLVLLLCLTACVPPLWYEWKFATHTLAADVGLRVLFALSFAFCEWALLRSISGPWERCEPAILAAVAAVAAWGVVIVSLFASPNRDVAALGDYGTFFLLERARDLDSGRSLLAYFVIAAGGVLAGLLGMLRKAAISEEWTRVKEQDTTDDTKRATQDARGASAALPSSCPSWASGRSL